MERICSLQYQDAIAAIAQATTVQFRRGVWNPYRTVSVQEAVDGIRKSGYSADVYRGADGTLYVSLPVSSDMW